MNLSTAISSYKQVRVTEISDEESPHELIRIVFGVLQENLATLKENVKFTDERWEKPFNKCMFALSILRESLDFEKGGEIAENLFRLYEYARQQIINDSKTGEAEGTLIAMASLEDIREAWVEIRSIL